jgi:hypothetical protein
MACVPSDALERRAEARCNPVSAVSAGEEKSISYGLQTPRRA